MTAIHVPRAAWARRSLYLKIRDRDSYAFALASAAVGLDMDGDTVREARIGLGGVATKPWRAREAEAVLTGQILTEAVATRAAEAGFAGARIDTENAFKPELGRRTLVRALLAASELES
jgi:xanthine dehydrogenase YagS FAD-binding subunit